MIETIFNYINGDFVSPRSNEYLDVFEPATGCLYARVPNSNNEDVEDAIEAARNAFPIWSNLSVKKRSDYLSDIALDLISDQDRLAIWESRDSGKPITLARTLDIPRAIENFTFFIDFIKSFKLDYFITSDESNNHIQRLPLGIVACISPWNLPLYLFTWKIIPALIVGNTVIAKPSEITPYSAFKLAQICKKIIYHQEY